MQYSVWKETPGAAKSGFQIHRIRAGNGWRFPEHAHRRFCELVCATHGSFLHVINGIERIQTAGEIVLIRENDVHRLAGRNFTYVNVMFCPDWFKRLEHFTQFAGMDDALLQAPTAPQANDPGQIPQIVRTAQYSIGK